MKNRTIVMAKRPKGMLQPEDFSIVPQELPSLRDGEVLIKVLYTLVDPIIRGWMVNSFGFRPMVPGDLILAMGVGRIIESRNEELPVGKIVSGMFGWQEFAISDGKTILLDGLQYGDLIVPIRPHDPTMPITHPIGVLGISTMTAYFGVRRDGPVVPGKSYVISGAAGSVGSVAGQIAKMDGGFIIGLAGSDEKCEWLTGSCGFDVAINYRTEDVGKRLDQLCPEGVQVYFDNVGGPLLDVVLDRMAIGARIVVCGATATYNDEDKPGRWGPSNYFNLCLRRASMVGTYCLDFYEEYPAAQEEVVGWIKAGRLHHKETVFDGLQSCPAALIGLFHGSGVGKCFVKIAHE